MSSLVFKPIGFFLLMSVVLPSVAHCLSKCYAVETPPGPSPDGYDNVQECGSNPNQTCFTYRCSRVISAGCADNEEVCKERYEGNRRPCENGGDKYSCDYCREDLCNGKPLKETTQNIPQNQSAGGMGGAKTSIIMMVVVVFVSMLFTGGFDCLISCI